MLASTSTTTDRMRRLAPSLDWVRARRREWQAGVGTGCGTERWRAAEDGGASAGSTPDMAAQHGEPRPGRPSP